MLDQQGKLSASTSNRLLLAAPDRPSATQFADYLLRRGLFAGRA